MSECGWYGVYAALGTLLVMGVAAVWLYWSGRI